MTMKRVLFYGDSNTYGFDPRIGGEGRYPENVRWTARVSEALAPGWEVLENGMNGRAVPHLRRFPEGPAYLSGMFAEAEPLTVFAVMLGTNNLFLRREPDAAETAEAMRRFLLFASRHTSAQILLIAPPFLTVSAVPELDPARCLAESRKLNRLYGELAGEQGYAFCDAESWHIDMACDGVHFSELGHAQFADHIVQEMAGGRFDDRGTVLLS